MKHQPPTTETDIWSRTINPEGGNLSPETAREWLRLKLSESDVERVRELSRRANIGELTADQERELESYLNVGQTLEFLHAKARLLLRGKPAG